MEESIEFEYKYNGEDFIDLIFAGKNFTEIKVKNYYEQNKQNKEYVEFLPGVYYKREVKYDERFVNKYVRNNKKSIIKLFVCYLLDKMLYEKQKIKVIFKIKNKRDPIKIRVNNEDKFVQDILYEDKEDIKYRKTLIKDYGNQKVDYREVETEKIAYPYKCGGNGDRCRVKGIFQCLGLLNNMFDNVYTFFDEHEMFCSSAKSKTLMKECASKEGCGNMYNKFFTNTYKNPSIDYWGNNIELIENNNGFYKIENANHRVCCAKRFKINKVYAKVLNEVSCEKEEIDNNYVYYYRLTYDNEKIRENFYNTLYNIGLTKKNARYILENGLRGEQLIEYIEDVTKKSFYQLALEKSSQNSM